MCGILEPGFLKECAKYQSLRRNLYHDLYNRISQKLLTRMEYLETLDQVPNHAFCFSKFRLQGALLTLKKACHDFLEDRSDLMHASIEE